MKINFSNFLTKRNILIASISVVIILLIVGYGEYRRSTLSSEFEKTNSDLSNKIGNLETELATIKNDSAFLNNALQLEQNKSSTFQEQIGKVTDVVGTINKLSKIDPQLLQKYSKIYFLNENYVPASLATITQEYIFNKDKPLRFLGEAMPFLQKLLQSATTNNVPLNIISSYRSFGTQSSLKSSYNFTYGAGTANSFSADQGYSEHQLGTAVDFSTPILGANFSNFETTTAYAWLIQNAYKYGFVLSYPKGNSYYQFEPWHWRFVGKDLAARLHQENKYFYDLDQRVINDYLLVIFD